MCLAQMASMALVFNLLHLLLLFIGGLLPRVTGFECPDIRQCRCTEERDWSDKTVGLYKVVTCERQTTDPVLNLSTIRNADIARIIIGNSSINRLDKSSFKDINIRDIEIRNTNTAISNGAFQPLQNTLRHLVLERVGIKLKRGLDFLKGLVQLKTLVIDSDDPFPLHFPGHKFANLSLYSLKSLSLRYCNIAKMSDSSFVGVEALEILDLSGNNISSVPGAILILRNLRKLVLSHNIKLYYVHDYAFTNLQRLEEIEMSHTHVHTVSQDAFIGLENSLHTLIIDHSQLPDGHFVSMKNLEKLKKLDMSFNKIVFIHNESFEGLDTLEELDISGQFDIRDGLAMRVQFTDTMFRGLERRLRVLKIRYLGLVSLPLAALAPLRSLDTLDASNNEFTDIYDGFFENIHARTILLTDMAITEISAEAFSGLRTPLNIMFDNNNVTNISFILDVKECAFWKLSFLGNPVSCDCDVIEISAAKRVRELTGTCSDDTLFGEDLQTLFRLKNAKEMCDIGNNIKSLECVETNKATGPNIVQLNLSFICMVGVSVLLRYTS